eukprot:3779606-Karenia_brevis.AAC.1
MHRQGTEATQNPHYGSGRPHFELMRIMEWPNPSNQPVLHAHVEHQCQATKQMAEAECQHVWQGDIAVAPQPTK